mmetsp:Transcript_34294/g.60676  ORF Transcript_34294/g.60676 Transcript_34294/m.60676 type:complete len:99 (-) Transcript_34294:194-490(-)
MKGSNNMQNIICGACLTLHRVPPETHKFVCQACEAEVYNCIWKDPSSPEVKGVNMDAEKSKAKVSQPRRSIVRQLQDNIMGAVSSWSTGFRSPTGSRL